MTEDNTPDTTKKANNADLEISVDTKKKKNSKLKWYIVRAISGREKSVAELIKQRVKANSLEDTVTEVFIPTQEKVVIKRGKKETVDERIFPGYILVQMEVTDDTLHLVRNTEGVQGFLGSQTNTKKPTPLNDKQVQGILAFTKVKRKPTYQSKFSVDDNVRVTEGPFKEFVGTIQDISEAKGQATVLLSIFGRETPVQLDFLQISKI